MSAEEKVVTISHQALRKGELRLMASEFEQKTREMLTELERNDIPELKRRLISAQLGKRTEFLARLQTMGLTTTPNDWAMLHGVWQQVMNSDE